MQQQNSALTFRSAVAADLEALVAMLADDELGAARETPSLPLNSKYMQAFEQISNDPNNELLLAVAEQSVIVRMLQLTFIPYLTHTGTTRALIEGVRVKSGVRNKGVGQQLINEAIRRARKRGCGMLQLTSDKTRPDAIRFYEKLGFVSSHEGMKLKL
jgi:GNAT superfamily N-acetyltransferase